ncbi:CHAT domain-containing protein [Youngiibacter fragilis]|uniref:CHAT domain-containing protein n=1 Tax=Youngiibacter fragilis 232.1 TaxID=994573 RepID=V7I732_9CLOT|nr:CHAT domain-containing protein [Youngiibacter fragilis]ETA80822.1 hypothetical protein T472_0209615 [Youngiibacter fragilis 232.1]
MMFGGYSKGGLSLPTVVHISISRFLKSLPKKGEPLQFLVSMHVEGTGVTWQKNVTVDPADEKRMLGLTQDLYLWSVNQGFRKEEAEKKLHELGGVLHKAFIGSDGEDFLKMHDPTTLLLNVDETIMNLPWELIGKHRPLALRLPFGRLVTTRILPEKERDALSKDSTLKILAIGNPTGDLYGGIREIESIRELEGEYAGYRIEVRTLTGEEATKQAFLDLARTGEFDIIHFAGHGDFKESSPKMSGIRFADGVFTAAEVAFIGWKSPPYIVFNSSCESGRSGGGKRLISRKGSGNGMAAAFIAAGVSGYAGYFYPVTDTGAALMTTRFYRAMLELKNIGLAFMEARETAVFELEGTMDLAGYSAIFYGDAATGKRRDVYTKA